MAKYVLNNLVAKLMALVMALALWGYAYNFSLARDKTFVVPVVVQTDEGWSKEKVLPEKVEIRLNCPRRFEARVEQALHVAQVKCAVSPRNLDSDNQTVLVPLKAADLRVSEPIRSLISNIRFQPAELQVELTREMTKSLEVRLKHSDPPAGYEISSAVTTPRSVRVRGPKAVMLKADYIETEQIDISQPLLSFEKVSHPSGSVALIKSVVVDETECEVSLDGATHVEYRITLQQTPGSRKFQNIPIHLRVPPNHPYEIKFEKRAEGDDQDQWRTNVTVAGRDDVVQQLAAENIHLYLNVGGYKPNEAYYNVPIQYNISGSSGMLDVKLGITSCKVKVSEPAPETPE